MAKNMFLRERMADLVLPLVVMAAYFTVMGRGFPSITPVAACTAFAVIQPFFRFFVIDRVRQPLLNAGKENILLGGAAVLYSGLALVISEFLV